MADDCISYNQPLREVTLPALKLPPCSSILAALDTQRTSLELVLRLVQTHRRLVPLEAPPSRGSAIPREQTPPRHERPGLPRGQKLPPSDVSISQVLSPPCLKSQRPWDFCKALTSLSLKLAIGWVCIVGDPWALLEVIWLIPQVVWEILF